MKISSSYKGYSLQGKHEIRSAHKEYLTFNFSFLSDDPDHNLDEDQVSISVNKKFIQSKRHLECDDGYWIFRLNDLGRVIGRKNENIYYLLAIDTKFEMYSHG